MRFLFLSNFYPPADHGGWEQWCQEITDALADRGHEVVVVTSRHQRDGLKKSGPHVKRKLFLESNIHNYCPGSIITLPGRDWYNRRYLESAIRRVDPDAIMIWGMWQLNSQLAVLAERLLPGRVAYYLCGYWPIQPDVHSRYWLQTSASSLANAVKRPIGSLINRALSRHRRRSPRFQHVACVSYAVLNILREGGLALNGANVIYGGIELKRFLRPVPLGQPDEARRRPLRILFAGSLTPAKGVDTVIAAMSILSEKIGPDKAQLTIVGKGHPEYERSLHDIVRREGIENCVNFKRWVPKDEMPNTLNDFDALVFPSRYEEPLARMMMEGLAAGLVLVSTTTGGSKEVLENGVNCLTFEAGNAEELSARLVKLVRTPGLANRLAHSGQEMAKERFDFCRMVDEIEKLLVSVGAAGE